MDINGVYGLGGREIKSGRFAMQGNLTLVDL
jgi:hypothetical protein